MLKVVNVVGARPNFMKIAPIMRAFRARASAGEEVEPLLVHTGQHYDFDMSGAFFRDLDIPEPDIHLGVGSGTHASQTAGVMVGVERVLEEKEPDLVVVVGDVNSTMAAALAAVKLHIPAAHVEAGLRSFDRSMPEEINRVLTDQVADLLFTTSEEAGENLLREGVRKDAIHFVGNVMIDTLMYFLEKAGEAGAKNAPELKEGGFALVTLHRPSNVDRGDVLKGIVHALGEISRRIPVVLPAHPRTEKSLKRFGLMDAFTAVEEGEPVEREGLYLMPPLDYPTFATLMSRALMVLTDSGGIQEETTVLGVPCLTLRETTERPVTVSLGTNELVGSDPERILSRAGEILEGRWKKGSRPPLWDGRAAQRIVEVILGRDWMDSTSFSRHSPRK